MADTMNGWSPLDAAPTTTQGGFRAVCMKCRQVGPLRKDPMDTRTDDRAHVCPSIRLNCYGQTIMETLDVTDVEARAIQDFIEDWYDVIWNDKSRAQITRLARQAQADMLDPIYAGR